MIPTPCHVRHDPPNAYGDCIRACVASLMELDTSEVPHFAHDNPTGDVMVSRVRAWLAQQGRVPCWIFLDGELGEVQQFMAAINPGVWYMLLSANHAVVCRDGEIVHDPAWASEPLVKPEEHWIIMVIA